MDPNPPSPSVEELVYALQKTKHILPRTSPVVHDPEGNASPATRDVTKHLRMLDQLALILVLRPRSDVAAVTMVERAQPETAKPTTTFFFVKNQPCSSVEKDHVQRLVEIANTPASRHLDITRELIELVFRGCRAKIEARVLKLHKSRQEMGSPPSRSPPPNELDKLATALEISNPSAFAWTDFVETFFGDVSEVVSNRNYRRALLSRLSARANFLTIFRFLSYLGPPKIQRRVEKLATYLTICNHLGRLIHLKQSTRIFRAEEVLMLGPPPGELVLRPSVMDILNRFRAGYTQSAQPITLAEVYRAIPSLQHLRGVAQGAEQVPSTPDPLTLPDFVRVRVHCECALTAGISQNVPGLLKIGVSKTSCGPCAIYLSAFAAARRKVVVSGTHGKMYPGWIPPTAANDQDIQAAMLEEVTAEMRRLVEEVDTRRGSDSTAEKTPSDPDLDPDEMALCAELSR
ncbi:MAG: hypothetical protein M4579_006624 [Chaenotheca gracillima]|nr:MAG: hypothetical protein M4579_006624 [Chaenotheca gracillima]